MPPKTQANKAYLRIGLIVGVVLLLLFIFRGPIRSTLGETYANRYVKPPVGAQFDEHFPSANVELAKLGFTFSETEKRYECRPATYSGIGISVSCTKHQASDPITVTPEFARGWERNSGAFEASMTANGWQKTWSNFALQQLYDNPNSEVLVSARYSKLKNSKLYCELSVNYLASSQKTWVYEQCYGAERLFGGVGYIARGLIAW